jgi:dolichyl-phosphate beta-glucosyltransferase
VGGLKTSDSQSGCKGFTAKAANEIFSRAECDGFAFDFEVLMLSDKLGFCVKEMPVKVINHRQSKISLISDSVKMTMEVLRIKKRIKHLNVTV